MPRQNVSARQNRYSALPDSPIAIASIDLPIRQGGCRREGGQASSATGYAATRQEIWAQALRRTQPFPEIRHFK